MADNTVRHAALKSAEDALDDVRQCFESADACRLNGRWSLERQRITDTRLAITRTMEHLTTLRGLL